MIDRDVKSRFLDKVYPEPNTGCWLWGAAIRGTTGYGAMRLNGSIVIDTHRLSFQIFKGDIPTNKLVCHTCDVRLCVNPDHLFLCTYKENYHDAVQKGRIIQSSPVDPSQWIHGVSNTYDHYGCRCDQCKLAKSKRMKKYKNRESRAGQEAKSQDSLS